MTPENETAIIQLLSRIADSLATIAASNRAPLPKSSGELEEIAFTVTRGGNAFKKTDKGGGFFYRGDVVLDGVKTSVSLGVHNDKCRTVFQVNQVVHCSAERTYRNGKYGQEIQFWLSELHSVENPVPTQSVRDQDDKDRFPF